MEPIDYRSHTADTRTVAVIVRALFEQLATTQERYDRAVATDYPELANQTRGELWALRRALATIHGALLLPHGDDEDFLPHLRLWVAAVSAP